MDNIKPLSDDPLETRGKQCLCGTVEGRHASNYIIKKHFDPINDKAAQKKREVLGVHKHFLAHFIPPTRIAHIDDGWIIVQKRILGKTINQLGIDSLSESTKEQLKILLQGCIEMQSATGVIADIRGCTADLLEDEAENDSSKNKWLRRLKALFHLRDLIQKQLPDNIIKESSNIIIDESGHPWFIDCYDDMSRCGIKADDSAIEKIYLSHIKPLILRALSRLLQKQHNLGEATSFQKAIVNLELAP